MERSRPVFVALCGLALAACGGADEAGDAAAPADRSDTAAGGSVADIYITNLESIAGALESVEDNASAEAAARTIEQASAEIEAITQDLEGPQAAMLFLSRQTDFVAAQQRISTAIGDLYVENPELGERLSTALDKVPNPAE